MMAKKMSKPKKGNNINGILLINKPQGKSSNAALQIAKRLFGAKKAGHTGSLDPLATGMLPVCFGEATKLCQYLLNADKCYQTTGHLGIQTDSSDSTGKIIKTVDSFSITKKNIEDVLSTFKGATKQTPSMFSALKHQGSPLYKYAREGIEIEREPRDIVISLLELEGFDGQQFSLKVKCSKGTYIRNLVEDIGEQLKVCAHVTQLHRCYIAGFEQEKMYSLTELESMTEEEKLQILMPLDAAVTHLPLIALAAQDALALAQGKTLALDTLALAGTVRLYNEDNVFIGIGECTDGGLLKSKRLIAGIN